MIVAEKKVTELTATKKMREIEETETKRAKEAGEEMGIK